MAKTSSGKRFTETKCEEGCQGRVLKPGLYCKCIESKLPKMGSYKSVQLVYVGGSIDNLVEGQSLYETPNEEDTVSLKQALVDNGLDPHEVDLVLARFVEDKTFREIAATQNWTSMGSCAYHFKMALKKLRERNFKLK